MNADTPTPLTDAEHERINADTVSGPVDSLIEALDFARGLERELAALKIDRDRLDWFERVGPAVHAQGDPPEPCDHEWEFQDDSFDHDLGCEQVHYWTCSKCGAATSKNPHYEGPENEP